MIFTPTVTTLVNNSFTFSCNYLCNRITLIYRFVTISHTRNFLSLQISVIFRNNINIYLQNNYF